LTGRREPTQSFCGGSPLARTGLMAVSTYCLVTRQSEERLPRGCCHNLPRRRGLRRLIPAAEPPQRNFAHSLRRRTSDLAPPHSTLAYKLNDTVHCRWSGRARRVPTAVADTLVTQPGNGQCGYFRRPCDTTAAARSGHVLAAYYECQTIRSAKCATAASHSGRDAASH
jgi:hypothetical protein